MRIVLVMSKTREIFSLFFKLGCTAFGGPAVHISMMENEVVTKRKWMTRQQFLDMMGVTNIIPGPNSTQMTMHCGYVRGKWIGLFVGGLSFVMPAIIFTLVLAIVYEKYGEMPTIAPFFYGIKAAVIGIIFNAVSKLGKKAFKSWHLTIIGVIIGTLSLLGMNEFALITGSGVLGLIWSNFTKKKNTNTIALFPALAFIKLFGTSIGNLSVFYSFFKIAMVLFGGGYVLVAYVDSEMVEKLGWITKQQLLDAVAMGQFTPGPILTMATFIGYQIQGASGALWASLGMFLPSFFLVGLLVKLLPVLRKSKLLSKVLDVINASAVGIMIAVSLKLCYELIFDPRHIIIMGMSIAVAFAFKKIAPFWIIVLGGLLGYLLMMIW